MTSELKCPLCGHNAKDDGLNNTWWCSNQYCDCYEENSSKPYNALMNTLQDFEIARQALEEIKMCCADEWIYTAADKALAQITHDNNHIADASKMAEHKEQHFL